MGNSILMYSIFFLGHIVSVSLILAIFTTVFVNSRKRGFVFLTIYLLLSIYSLIVGFDYSAVMGSGMLVIYLVLGVLTYFVIKNKLSYATAT